MCLCAYLLFIFIVITIIYFIMRFKSATANIIHSMFMYILYTFTYFESSIIRLAFGLLLIFFRFFFLFLFFIVPGGVGSFI